LAEREKSSRSAHWYRSIVVSSRARGEGKRGSGACQKSDDSLFHLPAFPSSCFNNTNTIMPRTREGYRHDPKNGLSEGFETDAVVEPRSNFSLGAGGKKRWDTIVIGAGYAGLIAARDLVIAGKSISSSKSSRIPISRVTSHP
jgi:hypothetical protein